MGTLADMYTASLSSNEDKFLRSLPDFFQANGWGPDASYAWADSVNKSLGGGSPMTAPVPPPTPATAPPPPPPSTATPPAMASAAASGLSPEIMAQLKGLTSPNQSVTIDGMTYSVLGQEQNNEGGYSFTPEGYTAFKAGTPLTPGAKGLQYGLDGQGTALPYEVLNGGKLDASDFKDLWEVAKTLGPMALAGFGAGGGFGDLFGGASTGGDMGMGSWGTGSLAGSGGAGADFGLATAPIGAGLDSTVAGGALGLNGVGNVDNVAGLTSGPAVDGLYPAGSVQGTTGTLIDPAGGPTGNPTGNTTTTPTGTDTTTTTTTTPTGPGTTPTIPGLPAGFDWTKFLTGIAGLVSGQSGSSLANSLRDELDPFRKYRDQYGQQLNALWADPSKLITMPGYQAGLTAVQRSMGAQGFQGSGNMMAALSEYGGGFFDKTLGQLETLSGANQNLGAGANTIANLTSAGQGSTGYGISQLLQSLGLGGSAPGGVNNSQQVQQAVV